MARRVSESDLLAYIEGDLPENRADEVRAALERDPKLAAWADAARADRDALRQWSRPGASIAPPDLVEQAMRQAERNALLGLDAGAAQQRRRPTVLFRFTGPRTAMAAALLAAVGLGVLYGPGLVQQLTPAPGPAPSQQPAPAPGAAAEPAEPAAPGASDATAPERDAGAPAGNRRASSNAAPPDSADAFAGAGAEKTQPTQPSQRMREEMPLRAIGESDQLADHAAPVESPLTMRQAADLAEQRRLRVRAETPDPASLGADLLDAPDLAFRVFPIAEPAPGGAMLIVEIDAGAPGLDAFLQTLGAMGAASISLSPLDEPVGLPPARGPSDVLWWTRSPAAWPGMGSALELEVLPAAQIPPPPPGG